MAEIENVPCPPAHGFEYGARFIRNHLRRGFNDQRGREVALQTNVFGNELARFGQGGLPVNPDDVRTSGYKVGPVAMRAEGKDNDGRSAGL